MGSEPGAISGHELRVVDLSESPRDVRLTKEAMESGADVIFQAPLAGAGGFAGQVSET